MYWKGSGLSWFAVCLCCMSWKTQITKVLISERTWGPCSWSLEVSLDSLLSQVLRETVSTTSLWEHLTEDMSPLVPGSVASPAPSPFPDAPIFSSERNSLDSEPASALWHWWQTRPEVQVQPELLQMSTECSQNRHTPVSVHLCVHCTRESQDNDRLGGTERGLLGVLHGRHRLPPWSAWGHEALGG